MYYNFALEINSLFSLSANILYFDKTLIRQKDFQRIFATNHCKNAWHFTEYFQRRIQNSIIYLRWIILWK